MFLGGDMEGIKKVFTSGTLGDTYIAILKMRWKYGNSPLRVYHKTTYTEWIPKIEEIYSLMPQYRVEFVTEKPEGIEEISPTDRHLQREYFPEWDLETVFKFEKPYMIFQPHSGKEAGGNTKKISFRAAQDIIDMWALEKELTVITLGTDSDSYSELINCINLIEKTDIKDTIEIIKNSDGFIGPEGLLSFIALSQKIRSYIYYSSYTAVEYRIVDTPWEDYCKLSSFMRFV